MAKTTTLRLELADVDALIDALNSVFDDHFDDETVARMDKLTVRLTRAYTRLMSNN